MMNYDSRSPIFSGQLDSIIMEEDENAVKERRVIEENRCKLCEYIHDVTLLFPYMREKRVFTRDDCDIVKSEITSTMRVNKFLDIMLTKGPSAIGHFHLALETHHQGVFEFLVQLFTNARVELSPSRQLKDNEQNGLSEPHELNATWTQQSRLHRHGSRTIRKHLEHLSKRYEVAQRAREDLQQTLLQREKEINALLSSREAYHSDLVVLTEKYQDIIREWKTVLFSQSESTTKELREREGIQAEYDKLDGEYMLVSSELSAARDRISQLLTHLERSEQVISITQDERDGLKDKYQGEIQRLNRKIERIMGGGEGGSEGSGGGSGSSQRNVGEGEQESQPDKYLQLQLELESAHSEREDLEQRLSVKERERKGALDEADHFRSKCYDEKERRKKAEEKLKQLNSRLNPADAVSISTKSLFSAVSPTATFGTATDLTSCVKVDEMTLVMSAPSLSGEGTDTGMELRLAVVVESVSEGGVAFASGVKAGDEIWRVNHLKLSGTQQNPVQFTRQLLSQAEGTITLSVKRQVPTMEGLHPSTPLFHFPLNTPPVKATPSPLPLLNSLEQSSSHERPVSLNLPNLTRKKVSSQHSVSTGTSSGADRSHDEQTTSSDGRPVSVSEGDSSDMSSGDGVWRLGERGGEGVPIQLDQNRNSKLSDNNSGIIHTPPPCCGDRHLRYPDDIDTLTKWPTISSRVLPEKYQSPATIMQDDEELCLLRSGEMGPCILQEGNTNPEESIKSIPTPVQLSFLDEHRESESDLEDPGALPRARQVIYRRNRDRNRERDRERRISRSMDDIQNIAGTPDEELVITISPQAGRREIYGIQKTAPEFRVLLPRGQLGEGLKIIGGRGFGIFIHSDRPVNRGLQSGDEITKIGLKEVRNSKLTYAEVTEIMESTAFKVEQVIITVQHNMRAYSELPVIDARDNFHVRAKFAHTRGKAAVRNELNFAKGDIFHVTDTLPLGYRGMWRVEKLGPRGQVLERGYVPTSLSPLEMIDSSQFTGSLPGIFRHFGSPKAGRRLGFSSSMENQAKMPAVKAFEFYEPIRAVQVTEPRPVVVLGALEDDVRNHLVEHGSTEDVSFCYCKREPIEALGQYAVEEVEVEVVTVEGRKLRSTVQHVQQLAREGKHCVLCLKASELPRRPAIASLCPIVLLLEAKHRHITRIRPTRSPSDSPNLHTDRIKEAKKYFHYLTGQIDLSRAQSMDDVIREVRETVAKQQKSIVWELDVDSEN